MKFKQETNGPLEYTGTGVDRNFKGKGDMETWYLVGPRDGQAATEKSVSESGAHRSERDGTATAASAAAADSLAGSKASA